MIVRLVPGVIGMLVVVIVIAVLVGVRVPDTVGVGVLVTMRVTVILLGHVSSQCALPRAEHPSARSGARLARGCSGVRSVTFCAPARHPNACLPGGGRALAKHPRNIAER